MLLKRLFSLISQGLLFGVILAILVYRYDLSKKMEPVINLPWLRELVYVTGVKALSYIWIVRAKITSYIAQILVIDMVVSVACLVIYLVLRHSSFGSEGVPSAFIFDIAEKSLVAVGLLLFFKASNT